MKEMTAVQGPVKVPRDIRVPGVLRAEAVVGRILSALRRSGDAAGGATLTLDLERCADWLWAAKSFSTASPISAKKARSSAVRRAFGSGGGAADEVSDSLSEK